MRRLNPQGLPAKRRTSRTVRLAKTFVPFGPSGTLIALETAAPSWYDIPHLVCRKCKRIDRV